jgi:hypothetical protein
MKPQLLHPKQVFILTVLQLLLIIFISISFNPGSAMAQGTQEPLLVTAHNDDDLCGISDQHVRTSIKFYSVGSRGGEAYSKATYFYPNTTQDLLSDTCTLTGYTEVEGTFTGGSNGTITFDHSNDVTGTWDRIPTTCQLMNGKTLECNYAIESLETTWRWVFTIENPEAFQTADTQEPTLAAGCTPNVRGLNPSKPGDVISPGASYVDASGKDVGVIQDRWFLNGVNTTSTIWDGKPVTVELQYTCLDHVGYSKTFTIPAFGEPPIPPQSGSQSDQQQSSEEAVKPAGVTPLGIAAIISILIGALGAVGAAGVAVSQIIGKSSKAPIPAAQPPVQQAPPPQTTQSTVSPDNPVLLTPPIQPILIIQPPANNIPANAQPNLSNIKSEMENEIERIKNQWQQTRNAVEKLKTLRKKNMIKFVIKQAWETKEWIMDGPVDLINKFTIDPLMEKTMGKHDTSQDGNIIVAINNRIESLKGEMQQMTNEVKYLRKEIGKINQNLKRGGK